MAMLDSTPQLAAVSAVASDAAPLERRGIHRRAFDRPAESRARARWFTRPVAVLTAAAAAAAIVLGGVVVTNQLANQSFQQAQAEQLDAITASADFRELTAEVAGGGTATLVWSNELGSAALMVDGIAPLPDSKTYQLWYIDGERRPPRGHLRRRRLRHVVASARRRDARGRRDRPHRRTRRRQPNPVNEARRSNRERRASKPLRQRDATRHARPRDPGDCRDRARGNRRTTHAAVSGVPKGRKSEGDGFGYPNLPDT